MDGLFILIATLIVPLSIWSFLNFCTTLQRKYRFVMAVNFPPLVSISALYFDIALNSEPDAKIVGTESFMLAFIIPFLIALAVVGACEAWFGRRTL